MCSSTSCISYLRQIIETGLRALPTCITGRLSRRPPPGQTTSKLFNRIFPAGLHNGIRRRHYAHMENEPGEPPSEQPPPIQTVGASPTDESEAAQALADRELQLWDAEEQSKKFTPSF